MRIIYTSILNQWDSRHGGGQRSAHDLAAAMASRGHQVQVVYSGSTDPLPDGLPYRAVLVPHHERLYLNPLEFARCLFGVDPPPDIVHAHGYEGALLSTVVRKRLPFIATTHQPDPPTLNGRPSVSRPLARLSWYRRLVIPLLERRALRSARAVVCVSKHSAKTLVERGYLPSYASPVVVYNGSNPVHSDGEAPPDVEFVCAARLDKHKGIDVLLRALSLMGGRVPRLDLLGVGPEEGALRKLVGDLRLDQRVRFQGLVEHSRLGAFLEHATALVLPSLAENFPRVILEGLRMGVPIVATSAGGIPEAVENEKQALVVAPGDPVALAAALERVRDDPALRKRLRAAALARSADFTWEQSAKELDELYTSLLQSRDRIRTFAFSGS